MLGMLIFRGQCRTQPHNGLSPYEQFRGKGDKSEFKWAYQIRLKFSTYRRRTTRLESWQILNSGPAKTISASRLKGLTTEIRGLQITYLELIPSK